METIAFVRACLELKLPVADQWAVSLTAAAEEFGITKPEHQAMWLAQLCHESRGLSALEENLNYSAERLAQVWPKRYAVDPRAIHVRPNELAHRLAHKPDCVANDVYAHRMGNGEPASGDGWKYRGRYPVMLTGRNSYEAAAEALEMPFLASDPDSLLNDIPAMARVCGWFWRANGIGKYADARDFDGVCDTWNIGRKTQRVGDSIGYVDRVAWHKRWLDAFGMA